VTLTALPSQGKIDNVAHRGSKFCLRKTRLDPDPAPSPRARRTTADAIDWNSKIGAVPIFRRRESILTKSFMANPQNIERKWFVVDAEGKTLGRLSSQIAAVLRGKHKPTFTTHVDCGDFVIVVNAEKIHMSGNKLKDKMYRHHTGYPGGLKETAAGKMLEKRPIRPVELAIKGMLPHNPLGRQMFRKLKVYAGPEHPHAAQMPEKLEI